MTLPNSERLFVLRLLPAWCAAADCALLLQGASAAALAPAQACLQGYQEVTGSQQQ